MSLSPAELEAIVENSPTLMWKSNKDKSISYFNNSWLKFRGRTLEEECNDGWQDGIHPDDLEDCLAVYEAHFDKRIPFEIRYRLKRYDGKYRSMLDRGYPQFNANNEFNGYVGYSFDITERTESANTELTSETRFRELVENTTDVIYSINSDGIFTYVSSAWKRQLGHELNEVVDESFTKFVHPDDISRCASALEEVFVRGQQITDIEYRVQHADGSWRWHSSSGSGKKDKTGTVTLFEGLAHDITQRKKDQLQISNQSAIQNLLIDLASNFINIQLDQVSESINSALQNLGSFFGSDRSYVFDYNWADGTTNNTYEWCAEGIEAEIDNLQGIPVEALPFWVAKHKAGEVLKIFDTEAPSVEQGLKDILLPQGIQSIMTIPMMLNETCIGFVGFDSVKNKREYTIAEEEMLVVFANMLVNISEREQAQSQLLNSRETAEARAKELREAQKIASLASWYYNLVEDYVTWSEELYLMYGFDPNLPPPPYVEQEKIFTPESWKRLSESVAKAASEGTPYELVLNFVRPDNSKGWMWAKGEALFDENKKVVGLRGVAQDITERKELELQLQESKEKHEADAKRLQVASTSAGLGIFDWDIIDNNLIWDERMYEMYGYPIGDGRTTFEAWSNRVHPDDLEQAIQDVNNAVEGHQEFNTTFRIVHPDGKEFYISGYGHVLRDSKNKAVKMIGVNMDITESQLHQRNLEFKNKQLVDFSNIVAHNLRAPLVNIGLLTDLIHESEDPEEAKEFTGQLKTVLDHLNEVFHELMESIQIRQDLDIESVPVDLQKHFNKTLIGVKSQIEKYSANIHADFSHASVIKYPSKYIDSIFSNLISNSLKYKSPLRKPEITVKTELINRDVILSVADNGLGFDMKIAEKNLFKIRKVFHKHPDARGFGLFLIKTQIDAMGGEIWAKSEPNVGSTFYVKFKNAIA